MTPKYNTDECDTVDSEGYQGMSSVNLEKSLNNLNVNVSQMASKVEEVACMFSEFSVKFSKQTEMLVEELKLLRIGVYQLGNNIRRRS